MHRLRKLQERKGETHIHVQLVRWKNGREGQCVGSEELGSADVVLKMVGVLHGLR